MPAPSRRSVAVALALLGSVLLVAVWRQVATPPPPLWVEADEFEGEWPLIVEAGWLTCDPATGAFQFMEDMSEPETAYRLNARGRNGSIGDITPLRRRADDSTWIPLASLVDRIDAHCNG